MPGLHFEMIERVDQGRRVREGEFDKSIFPRVKELAEKYDIKYDPAHPVPDDDAMADRLFAAGMEYAVEKGLWVLDTQKVVKFSEAEIWRFLDNYHTPLTFGYGKDQVTMYPRRPESDVRPLVIGGAAGSSMTEGEIYVKHMMNFALEPTNDMIANGNPAWIEGREIRPFSPNEVHGAIQEVGWIREATRRSGRPGMPLFVAPGCAASAPPAVAVINEERGLRKGDFLYAALLTELKSDYDRLIRAVAAVENGVHVATLLAPMIGGWAGPPEGAAICGAAETLLGAICHSSTIVVNHPVHIEPQKRGDHPPPDLVGRERHWAGLCPQLSVPDRAKRLPGCPGGHLRGALGGRGQCDRCSQQRSAHRPRTERDHRRGRCRHDLRRRDADAGGDQPGGDRDEPKTGQRDHLEVPGEIRAHPRQPTQRQTSAGAVRYRQAQGQGRVAGEV